MKYLMRRLIFSALALGLALVAAGEQEALADKSQPGELNLAFTKVENEAAQRLLRSNVIPVRNRNSDYMPSGEVPLLLLERPTEGILRLQLEKVIARHSPKNARELKVKRQGDIIVAQAGDHRYWASLSSGAYKFTDARNSMVNRSRFRDFKEAVQTALQFIAEKKVAELIEGESLDILFVSAVKNALTEVGKGVPTEEFLSDFYVVFGRRYRGVPVIDSRLMVRLNSEGKVFALEKSWRSVEGVSDKSARVSKKPLQTSIIQDPKFKRYSEKSVKSEDITIVHRRCGYLEAPVNYRQAALRPGCIVSFRIGDQFAESYPQIVVSLEEGICGEELWGDKVAQKARKE